MGSIDNVSFAIYYVWIDSDTNQLGASGGWRVSSGYTQKKLFGTFCGTTSL